MAGKTQKQKVRDIHEKYAREFAQKLKDKDAMISRLIRERDKALESLKSANQELKSKDEQITRLNAEIERLAGMTNMTEEDLIAFRKDMANREKAQDALAMLRSLAGPYLP